MRILRRALERHPLGAMVEARTARDALRVIAAGDWDALITDINLEGEGLGLDVARRARAAKREAPIMY